ncbi:MAG: hypothetical protein V4505_25485 [Pseudomonadota bacterium]
MGEMTSAGLHISDIRAMLTDQLRRLQAASTEQLAEELRRSKGVAELGQVIVNTAYAEVAYIVAVRGASDSTFLQAPDEDQPPSAPTSPQSPLPAPDDPARLGGPSPEHPWRGSVVRHKLKA